MACMCLSQLGHSAWRASSGQDLLHCKLSIAASRAGVDAAKCMGRACVNTLAAVARPIDRRHGGGGLKAESSGASQNNPACSLQLLGQLRPQACPI
ncbi:hypothetical protein DL95DRAFT_392682 [Leptodontidium sp. 2 PMI_412]|nr:hypothetical protein DL95DRAFT_392682 [Leptodontidium sp. 2 PMI_412]